MTVTVAVLNQKGGSGKTTAVLGLASAASARGIETLVIDLDPQCNVSEALGITYPAEGVTTAHLLAAAHYGGAVIEAVHSTAWEHVSLIPADLDLADTEAVSGLGVEQRLRSVLDSDELRARFALIVIDCPPSVSRLVANALIAADTALIASEPSFTANRGVAKVLESVETIKRYYHPGLTVAGVLLGRVPAQGRETGYRASELREALGDQVLPLVVPQRAAIAEALGEGRPIHQVRPAVPEVVAAFDAALDRVLAAGGAK